MHFPIRHRRAVVFLVVVTLTLLSCGKQEQPASEAGDPAATAQDTLPPSPPREYYRVPRRVTIRGYFAFMDSLVVHLDSTHTYPLTEHYLVRANPWIIDTLQSSDYYRLMARDSFLYDPKAWVVFREGDSLLIPDSLMMDSLRFRLAATVIDINIPEYKLRIIEQGEPAYEFPVRVGRNERKYLAMANRRVDLRTRPGAGEVFRVNRHPVFINPSNNHRYEVTRRDDGRVTLLPGIPWIDVELDGQRYGQLIHPTTNPETLGRAYSNGCIGTGEAAAWRIYYSAPVGTRVVVRYDLKGVNEQGDTIRLRDIYPGFEKYSPPNPLSRELIAMAWPADEVVRDCSPDCIAIWEEGPGEFLEAK